MLVRLKILSVLALALLMVAGLGRAQDSSEHRLKAAFLYNFAKFVEWPPGAFTNETAPLLIGVLGENPIGPALEQTVGGKLVGKHPVVVQFYRAASEATNCHVLFITASEKRLLAEVFRGLGQSPVLTVGQAEQFTELGGMINFVFEDKDKETQKVRFQINDEAARAVNLKLSSKLLSLAVRNPAR